MADMLKMDSAWLCNYIHPVVLQAVDKIGKTLIIPEVEMTFQPEDKAYEMYNTYAGNVGFSIRNSYIKRRADKTICQKYIVYSNQGHRENELS
jgi:zinc finger SWIM domain-containing protein 3